MTVVDPVFDTHKTYRLQMHHHKHMFTILGTASPAPSVEPISSQITQIKIAVQRSPLLLLVHKNNTSCFLARPSTPM